MLPRLEARGRTSYINNRRRAVTMSSLDVRFVRAKSPRSRQYILRSEKSVLQQSSQYKNVNLMFYRRLVRRRMAAQGGKPLRWTRGRRHSFSTAFTLDAVRLESALGRNKHHLRRTQDALSTRAKSLSVARKRLAYRTAPQRTLALLYRKAITLPSRSVFSNSSFALLQRTNRARNKLRSLRVRSALRPKSYRVLSPKRLGLRAYNKRGGLFRITAKSTSRRRFAEHFRSEAGRQIVRSLDVARACGLYTKFRRQAPFETHRPRL